MPDEKQTITSADVGSLDAVLGQPTLQDRLDALLESHGLTMAAVERRRDPDTNAVTFWVTLEDGDKIAGKGTTTADAIAALETKLEGWKK